MYKAGEINEQCCAKFFAFFLLFIYLLKINPVLAVASARAFSSPNRTRNLYLALLLPVPEILVPGIVSDLESRVSGRATMARVVTPQLILWFSTFVVTWVDSVGYYHKKQLFISVSSGACILSGPQCSCGWTSFTSWDHKIRMSLLTCHQMF